MSNEEIINEFYMQYFRAPKIVEFKQCGGNMKKVKAKYGCYENFLKQNRLPCVSRSESIEVVDEKGEVIFVGVPQDIADEFETTRGNVEVCLRKGSKYRWKYKLRVKKFKGHL